MRAHASLRWNYPHLHGVHGNVDAAVQQSIVDLLGEQTLATNVSQRLVQDLVASRLDDANLQGAILTQLGEVLLQFEPQQQLR